MTTSNSGPTGFDNFLSGELEKELAADGLGTAQPVSKDHPNAAAFTSSRVAANPRSVATTGSGQQRSIPYAEIRVGGHYMIESAHAPITSTHPDLYIWRCIGFMGRRVVAVPAYNFRIGKFVDDVAPQAAVFNVVEAIQYNGAPYDVAQFFDATGTIKELEAQATRAGAPRALAS